MKAELRTEIQGLRADVNERIVDLQRNLFLGMLGPQAAFASLVIAAIVIVGCEPPPSVRRGLAVVALDLQGRVADAEAVLQQLLEATGPLLRLVEGEVAGEPHVGRQGDRAAAERPDVEVVDLLDAGLAGRGRR